MSSQSSGVIRVSGRSFAFHPRLAEVTDTVTPGDAAGGGSVTLRLEMREQEEPWAHFDIPAATVERWHRELHARGGAAPPLDGRAPATA